MNAVVRGDSRGRWLPLSRALGVVVGLLFLWLALRGADLPSARAALVRSDGAASLAVFVAALAFIALKTLRWSLILTPVASARFGPLHRLVYIGTAANILIPHSGELLRSTLLARQSRQPLYSGTVLGTVAVERILDFAALALLAGLAIVIDPRVSPWLWSAGAIGLVLVAAGISVIVAVLDPDTPLKTIGTWLVHRIPAAIGLRLHHHVYRAIEGLGTLREPRRLLTALALSLLQWSTVVFAVWFSCQAVGVDLSVSAAISVFVLTVIGLTLPSAPAQVGTTQLAFVAGLNLAGAETSAALAASLVYNAWFVIVMLVIGATLWFSAPRSRRA